YRPPRTGARPRAEDWPTGAAGADQPGGAPSRASRRASMPRACPWRARGLMETAGIEPASAIAQEGASTSVAGALVSSRGRLAGGVPRDQPPEDVPGLAEADRPG